MSEYTTRPSVRTVTASPNTAAAGAAAVAGLVLAGAAVAALIRTASEAWQATSATDTDLSTAAASLAVLQSPRSLREQFSAAERQAATALLASQQSAPDALRLATVQALAQTPFHARGSSLDAPVAALLAARDVPGVERARTGLLAAIERDHLGAFVQHLSQAAAGASREVGFASIEVKPSVDGASARVIATDAAGRSLVSEIAPDRTGEVSLATEVIGVHDGSCHAVLDRFDAALERIGVRSGPPQRTTTGGVCELAFAREELQKLLRSRARPAASPRHASGSSSARTGTDELSRRRGNNRPSDRTQTKS